MNATECNGPAPAACALLAELTELRRAMRRLAVVWRQERGVPVMVQLANELDDVLDHDLLAGPYPKR